jgi:hypothetical protein
VRRKSSAMGLDEVGLASASPARSQRKS